jgi:putative flavoprotein involved in K+ transport
MSENPRAQIEDVLAALQHALRTGDIAGAAELFDDDCYWRDLVTFTWNITTLEGRAAIEAMLHQQLLRVRPDEWSVDKPAMARSADGMTEGFIRFTTAAARGHGYIRLRNGRIWTLMTAIEGLKGHEEAVGRHRPAHARDVDLGPSLDDRRGTDTDPYVLIVGGGQGGLMLAARLRQLDVPTVVVDRNERPGDGWRKRYKTLTLHNPIWENQFPYLDFPTDWPVFLPKDRYAEWLDTYAQLMRIDYWGSSPATSASWDPTTARWTVSVKRNGGTVELHPHQLVLATGAFGDKPQLPTFPGQELFEGTQLHSSQFTDAAAMTGKRCVVVGSGVSAHDVSSALVSAGASVTMIQRSSTHVVRTDSLLQYQLDPLYSADAVAHGIDVDTADLLAASLPFKLFFGIQKMMVDQVRQADEKFYDALSDAGFEVDFGPHGSGLFGKAMTGAFNYYVDIGASQMIIDGVIGLESGTGVARLTKDGVVLENGKELPADVVVYATGFTSMMETTAELISPEVADTVGKIWGLGSGAPRDPGPWEGELRNMWKPTQQEGLWFQGSLISQARFFSRILALQLKARMEALDTTVYGLQESHHVR